VGRLIPEKGIDILIDAIKDTDDKIKLLVVGGTAFSDSSKNEFSEKLYKKAEGFEHKIKFTGYTDFKNLPDYYSAADFAVFPSQCPEAAGLVLIEAQSASKPVIVTKVGGMCEYVSEKSGITVDNGEKLLRELKSAITEFCISEEKRKEMGKNAKIFAENFDKKGYINKIVQSCNEV